MQSIGTNDAQTPKFPSGVGAEQWDVASLDLHLHGVLEGDAFKGSHRSGKFLKYVVGRAVAGDFDSLKERAIGIEVFGRPPGYDTSADAIVRVTASDVRKRLLQHQVEQLVVEAKRVGVELRDLIDSIEAQWKALDQSSEVKSK